MADSISKSCHHRRWRNFRVEKYHDDDEFSVFFSFYSILFYCSQSIKRIKGSHVKNILFSEFTYYFVHDCLSLNLNSSCTLCCTKNFNFNKKKSTQKHFFVICLHTTPNLYIWLEKIFLFWWLKLFKKEGEC